MGRSLRQRIGDLRGSLIDTPVSRAKAIVSDPSSDLKKSGTVSPGSTLGADTTNIQTSRDVFSGGGSGAPDEETVTTRTFDNTAQLEEQARLEAERLRQEQLRQEANRIQQEQKVSREKAWAIARFKQSEESKILERREQEEQFVRDRTFNRDDLKTKFFPGAVIGTPEKKFKDVKTGTEFVVEREKPFLVDVTRQGTRTDMIPTIEDINVNLGNKIEPFKIVDFNKPIDAPRKETFVKPPPSIPEEAFGFKFDISDKPDFVQRAIFREEREQAKGEFTVGGIVGGLTAGATSSVVGTGQFVKTAVTQPVETFGQTLQVVTVDLPQNLASIGAVIEDRPAFAVGFLAGEFATFKGIQAGQKLAIKGFDVVRTSTLTELPTESIIAPEYFKGQRYPAISSGQTAGELLKEFKIPTLPDEIIGEFKGAGFTASPNPISDKIVGAGSSEIKGLYQAPKVSPTFLRVIDTGEGSTKLGFSLLGDTLRPTTFRITPTGFELGKGVKSSTNVIQSGRLAEIKAGIESAPKGQSTIPFIKTEKEAILTVGTELVQKPTRYYFKFEGRRIPIQEFDVMGEGGKVGEITTAGEIADISSSSRIGRKSTTPFEIGSRGKDYKISDSSISSSLKIDSSSIKLPSSTSRVSSSKTSRVSSGVSSRGSSISTPSSISSISSSVSSKPSKPSSRSSIRSSLPSNIGSSYGKPYRSFQPPVPKEYIPRISTKAPRQQRQPTAKFGVEIRRFGKFKTIGQGTLQQALTIGKGAVGKTLGATFRLTPLTKGKQVGNIRTPKGFYRGKKGKDKLSLTFIEKRSQRLSTGTETKEIKEAKRRKTPRKRKRRKKT